MREGGLQFVWEGRSKRQLLAASYQVRESGWDTRHWFLLRHFLRFQGALGSKIGENRGLLFTDEYMGIIFKFFIALWLYGI